MERIGDGGILDEEQQKINLQKMEEEKNEILVQKQRY